MNLITAENGTTFVDTPESRKLLTAYEIAETCGHDEAAEALMDKLVANFYALPGQQETALIDCVINRAIKFGYADRYAALEAIRGIIDRKSLFHAAKHWGVLVNDSAEEFAIQFYTAYNNEVRYTY